MDAVEGAAWWGQFNIEAFDGEAWMKWRKQQGEARMGFAQLSSPASILLLFCPIYSKGKSKRGRGKKLAFSKLHASCGMFSYSSCNT
eukprot:1158702-Pelagomonas_calceolata.AAC.21